MPRKGRDRSEPASEGSVAAGGTAARRALSRFAHSESGIIELAREATLSLDLLAPDIGPPPFATPEVTAAIRQFLTGNSKRRARLLLHDADAFARHNTLFIELAGRLADAVSMRRLRATDREDKRLIFLADDGQAALYRPNGAHPRGWVLKDGADLGALQSLFEQRWQHGTPHPALRRLFL